MAHDRIDIEFVRKVVRDSHDALGPPETAGILPAEAYTSDEFFEFERQAIFRKSWLCIGHVNEVPNTGDYLQLTVAGEPVLMVRDEEGTVRVISAICQHRGHPIVGGVAEGPPPGKCLNARRLVCPYHHWTYSLKGELIGAPAMDATVSMKELRETIRLPAIRTEIFHGLVFINLGDEPRPVASIFEKLDRELQGYSLETLVPGHVFPQEDLEWNWKLHHENALESYHTTYVHGEDHSAVPAELTRFFDYAPGDGAVMRTAGYLTEDGDLFEKGKYRRVPAIGSLTPEQRSRVLFVSLMPSAVMVLQPSMVSITFVSPTSARRMNSRRVNLFSPQAAALPDFRQLCEEQFEQIRTIIRQDAVTQEALQRAYHSAFKPRGRLCYLETAITQLNAWVVERYDAGLAARAPDAP